MMTNTNKATNENSQPTILVREGKGWRQYLVISNERVAIVEMVPALLSGWNFQRVSVQGSTDWPGMSRDAIVAWKFRNDDGRTAAASVPASFLATLLKNARFGRIDTQAIAA